MLAASKAEAEEAARRREEQENADLQAGMDASLEHAKAHGVNPDDHHAFRDPTARMHNEDAGEHPNRKYTRQ